MINFQRAAVVLFIVSSSLVFGCNAVANSPKDLRVYKMPLIHDVETKVSFSNRNLSKVNVSLSYESSYGTPVAAIYASHKPQFVERVVGNVERLIGPFLRSKGFYGEECRGYEYNLNIFVVSKSVLQDNNRFKAFYMRNGRSHVAGHTLYGYYDSTPEVKNNSTILVTNVGHSLNEEVLAHELSHYWWDRLCVASVIKQDSEEFAREFQRYYMRNR